MSVEGNSIPPTDAGDEYGVVIHVIEKSDRVQIRISLNEYRGYEYIDFRVFFDSGSGWKPSKKGLTMNKDSFAELFRGVVELGAALGMDEESLLDELNDNS